MLTILLLKSFVNIFQLFYINIFSCLIEIKKPAEFLPLPGPDFILLTLLSPYFFGDLPDQFQLRPLFLLGQLISDLT